MYFIYSPSLISHAKTSSIMLNRNGKSRHTALIPIAVVQSLSQVWLFLNAWTAEPQASLSFTNYWSLLKLISFESVMPSNHLILCPPLLLLPSIFPSIRVFSNELGLYIRWPKYCSFSFSINLSNEYSGLISSRIDWIDLLAVQGNLKSFSKHHSLKASILWHSAIFMVQISHPYMTTGKTIALPRQTFVNKETSLLFNMLSRLVIAFLPRINFFFSQLQSLSTVILETWKIKSVIVFIVFYMYLPWSDGIEFHDLHFFDLYIPHQPSQRKRNAKRHNGCLRRPYK